MERLDKALFAIASYNAGPARIAGLRTKAQRMGLDRNRWFANVEVVAAREIGRETVQYVSNIYKYLRGLHAAPGAEGAARRGAHGEVSDDRVDHSRRDRSRVTAGASRSSARSV